MCIYGCVVRQPQMGYLPRGRRAKDVVRPLREEFVALEHVFV